MNAVLKLRNWLAGGAIESSQRTPGWTESLTSEPHVRLLVQQVNFQSDMCRLSTGGGEILSLIISKNEHGGQALASVPLRVMIRVPDSSVRRRWDLFVYMLVIYTVHARHSKLLVRLDWKNADGCLRRTENMCDVQIFAYPFTSAFVSGVPPAIISVRCLAHPSNYFITLTLGKILMPGRILRRCHLHSGHGPSGDIVLLRAQR
eukprot:SAG31_NODE_8720_length_1400_cov_0.827825_1_plen_204_part_00